MKKIYSTPKILLAIVFILFAWIPNGTCQKNPDKKKSFLKPFYTMEANFGISTCMERGFITSDKGFEPKLCYQTLVYGANFMVGIELTHYFKAGWA